MPVFHQDEFGPDQHTIANLCRMIEKRFDKPDRNLDRMESHFDELNEKMSKTRQRLAGLELDARQSGFATDADVKPDTTTRKRREDAASDPAKHGDSCSAKKVDPEPMCLTSFGDNYTEPPPLSCRDDAMVDKGAAGPKPCLSLV